MENRKVFNRDEVIIRLLGRLTFTHEEIKEIVVGSKRKKLPWIQAYNLCDGKHLEQGDIAEKAGIDGGDFSRALQEWERVGIVRSTSRLSAAGRSSSNAAVARIPVD